MRIALIQPPIEDFYNTTIRLQPIGLAYLKAVLKQNWPELEVKVMDFQQGWGKRSIPLPKELRFLRAFYQFPDVSPFSSFYHYYRFGAQPEQVLREVAAFNPDLIGIALLFTAYAPQALQLARLLKRHLKVPILLGGSHVSAQAESLLALPFVDFVIRGEGERPIVHFVEAWLGGKRFDRVPNLGFKKGNRWQLNAIEENFPVDDLPFPDFSDLNLERYTFGRQKLSFVISSRGCPYRCAFCSVHQTFGRQFRFRSVENILREVQLRVAQGVRVIDFEDDNLTLNVKRFENLCQELTTHFAGTPLRFLAMNGISYFRLSPQTLDLMRAAGFTDLNLSLVSRDTKLLKQLKRPYNIQRFEQLVERAQQLGMQVVSYQILGLPGESVQSMVETMVYLTRLPVRIGVSPFYLTPEMSIASTAQQDARPSWVLGRLTTLGPTTQKRQTLFTLFVIARVVNFLKGLKLDEAEVALSEILSHREKWKGRTFVGFEILARLLNEKKFFVFNGNAYHPLPVFDVSLFQYFWKRVAFIKRFDGGIVRPN